jgi:hypothetical protein
MEELKLHSLRSHRLDGNPWATGRGSWSRLRLFGPGLMHAPAVGRALSELVLDGEYRTLDLTITSAWDNEPYAESGIR